MELTYLLFHLIFTIPILVVLKMYQPEYSSKRQKLKTIGIYFLLALCYLYTIPWDNIMIAIGVWSYDPNIVAFTVWHAPLGEYLFFGIQTIVTALWLHIIGFRYKFEEGDMDWSYRVGGLIFLTLIFCLFMIQPISSSMVYLAGIILWCIPIVMIQWGIGGSYLMKEKRSIVLAVLPPTIYYSAIDYIAIYLNLWTISDNYSLGINIGVIPIEEIIFFFMTNTMIIFGLVLYSWVFYNWNLYYALYNKLDI